MTRIIGLLNGVLFPAYSRMNQDLDVTREFFLKSARLGCERRHYVLRGLGRAALRGRRHFADLAARAGRRSGTGGLPAKRVAIGPGHLSSVPVFVTPMRGPWLAMVYKRPS